MCKCRRARCSDCVSGRATGRVNIIKKKKGVIKQSIAHRRSPWLCQPLWRRKHFNSPLSSICACGGSHGCRRPLFITTDRSQICWFAELWEEDGGGGMGVRASEGVGDGAGQTVGAISVYFPPQQLTVSPLPDFLLPEFTRWEPCKLTLMII